MGKVITLIKVANWEDRALVAALVRKEGPGALETNAIVDTDAVKF
ncbi:MAG TPA: hypothetical protein VGV18_10345 [Verrucomicrobiae bacterium]|nr:hypothetical protein [Verrucomicrobiae bacterium]